MITRFFRTGFSAARRDVEERSRGFSLLEVAFAMSIILTILLGVMASISTASVAEMNSSESLASQFLLSQTMEELKNNDFDNLITFNGQTVTSGTNTATITAAFLTADLVRLQVNTVSTQFASVTNSAVLLIANTN